MIMASYISELLDGKSVASSRLPKSMLDRCVADGLLAVSAHGTRKSVRARDVEALRRFLKDEDESNRVLELDDISSRAAMASSTGNSKLLQVRSCPGFPVNSYMPIECTLEGKAYTVFPAEGTFTFVCDWKSFAVPEDILIVGIENMENFRMIGKQKVFFEKCLGERRFLFVSRYPQSTDLRKWLQATPNRYVHFGDFDLAGIHIFQTEFQSYLGERASFLIPDDIEMRISQGSSQRYDNQLKRFGNIRSDDASIQDLIDLIHRYRKAYDQEGYIEL